MDASFLIAMTGQLVGMPLFVLGAVLSLPQKSRWFALPVVAFGILGAAIVTITDSHMPYTRGAVFWGSFTVIALLLGAVSTATAIVIALANMGKGNHAA